jgi:hypothetical protein
LGRDVKANIRPGDRVAISIAPENLLLLPKD